MVFTRWPPLAAGAWRGRRRGPTCGRSGRPLDRGHSRDLCVCRKTSFGFQAVLAAHRSSGFGTGSRGDWWCPGVLQVVGASPSGIGEPRWLLCGAPMATGDPGGAAQWPHRCGSIRFSQYRPGGAHGDRTRHRLRDGSVVRWGDIGIRRLNLCDGGKPCHRQFNR